MRLIIGIISMMVAFSAHADPFLNLPTEAKQMAAMANQIVEQRRIPSDSHLLSMKIESVQTISFIFVSFVDGKMICKQDAGRVTEDRDGEINVTFYRTPATKVACPE